MQRFDCLDPNTQVLGPHFLEASAGTGKTFAIENVFARLLSHMELNQILVVTFTKAATRELKKRIRAAIRNSKEVKKFDEAQIFTIHGFCMRMLQEHGLEAGLPVGLKQEHSEGRVDAALKDFLEFQCSEILAPEQLRYLLKDSVSELANLLKTKEPLKAGLTFQGRWGNFRAALQKWAGEVPDLVSLFQEIQPKYKAFSSKNFGKQVEFLAAAFQNPEDCSLFRKLIVPSKKVLTHLKPENRKVKFKDHPLPPVFEWACQELAPLLEAASNSEEILADLLWVWKPIQRKILLEEGGITPDEILRLMGSAVEHPLFQEKVRGRYRAVLIDEFQDTDPLQWKIFRSLFLDKVDAFYLIGDPKQSIYRFRNADLYTYLEAKRAFSSDSQYHLDTNYRSSPAMIDALNRLFDRNWLTLPKLSLTLPYVPMKAGLTSVPSLSDEKSSIHFYPSDSEGPESVAREILRLHAETQSFSAFAILVKDRYELAEYAKHLKQHGIPVVRKSRMPITETLAFESLYEWMDAVRYPQNMGKAKRVLAGPLGRYLPKEILALNQSPFPETRSILDKEGVIVALRAYLSSARGLSSAFLADWEQVLELFFAWVEKHGFQFERAERFFHHLMQKHEDELPNQRGEGDQEGVQIMTMHASKGLEFDIVFATGLGSKSSSEDAEESAEKMRQLYVAMTRAKRRLYIPVPQNQKIDTPISQFLSHISEEELVRLKAEKWICWESIDRSQTTFLDLSLAQDKVISKDVQIPDPVLSYLLSFSSLAQGSEEFTAPPFEEATSEYTKHNLPRGTEIGVFIHNLFETVFSTSAWHHPEMIRKIVSEQVAGSQWKNWEKVIYDLVLEAIHAPIQDGWCLAEIPEDRVAVEKEFLFQQEDHFVKGFIDLIVERDGKIYLIDWKTNWLGPSDLFYTDEQIQKVLLAHQYPLQASIYTKAILQGWEIAPDKFGGAIYFFLRAGKAVFWRPTIYG